MNMGFSVSNLMIVAMTVVVVFGDDEEPVTSEENVPVLDWKRLAVYEGCEGCEGCEDCEDFLECQDQLEDAGFSKNLFGFQNLGLKIPSSSLIKDLKIYDQNTCTHLDLKIYKEYITKIINQKYVTSSPKNSFAVAYYFGLALNVLNPNYMLPVKTWCNIHEKGTYYAKDFMKIDDNPYRKYLQRIARNTGVPKMYQTTIYRTIDVCFGEVSNHFFNKEVSNQYLSTNSNDEKTGFPSLYYKVMRDTGFEKNALSWCSINACFETLMNAGFSDAHANYNIKKIVDPNFEIKETSGYIFDFYQYLKGVSEGLTDKYEIVNPHDSQIGIRVGYLRNWCGIQVCHADLMDAGYIYESFTDNYLYVLPQIKHLINPPDLKFFETRYHLNLNDTSRILSEFVENFSKYLNDTAYTLDGIIRSPLEWCKYDVCYPSYRSKI